MDKQKTLAAYQGSIVNNYVRNMFIYCYGIVMAFGLIAFRELGWSASYRRQAAG
jgi:hypothetical protein